MKTTCACTLSRVLTAEESERIHHLARTNGPNRVGGPLVAGIARFSNRRDCPYLHRFDEETGYCSCQEFIAEWTAELGETAGLRDGRIL